MNFMTFSVTSTPFDLMMPKPLSSGSTVTRARHSSFTRQASAFESTRSFTKSCTATTSGRVFMSSSSSG